MIRVLLFVLLVLPVLSPAYGAQDQGQSQPVPETPAPDNQSQSPTTPERQSHHEANQKMRDEILDTFEGDPILDGANIHPRVNDEAITLTGTVRSEAQRQRALQLVDPYTRWRKVVDKIIVE